MDKSTRSPLACSFEMHPHAGTAPGRTTTTYLMSLRQVKTFSRERPDQARCTDER
jgi:hypothetical protein